MYKLTPQYIVSYDQVKDFRYTLWICAMFVGLSTVECFNFEVFTSIGQLRREFVYFLSRLSCFIYLSSLSSEGQINSSLTRLETFFKSLRIFDNIILMAN